MNHLKPKRILHGFTLPNSDHLTAKQVSDVLRCTQEHVLNLGRAQLLVSINISSGNKQGIYRIPRASLIGFIKERTTGPVDADFQTQEAPHELVLPRENILKAAQVADFLCCSVEHVYNLINAGEILATNIARTGIHQYRIARSSLVQFINSRIEGAD